MFQIRGPGRGSFDHINKSSDGHSSTAGLVVSLVIIAAAAAWVLIHA
jgi:hypothetical protein